MISARGESPLLSEAVASDGDESAFETIKHHRSRFIVCWGKRQCVALNATDRAP